MLKQRDENKKESDKDKDIILKYKDIEEQKCEFERKFKAKSEDLKKAEEEIKSLKRESNQHQ